MNGSVADRKIILFSIFGAASKGEDTSSLPGWKEINDGLTKAGYEEDAQKPFTQGRIIGH